MEYIEIDTEEHLKDMVAAGIVSDSPHIVGYWGFKNKVAAFTPKKANY